MANVSQPVITTDINTDFSKIVELVLIENKQVLEKINYSSVIQLGQAIMNAQRIFVAGEGRSGLVTRMFAMRLMHLGRQVYVVGETITPAIQQGDLLIDFSGSGSTEHVLEIACKAKEIGAYIASVTTQIDSPLAKIADFLIHIEAAAKQDHSHQHSQQFSGSLFEQSSLLIFDALFHFLSHTINKSSETLWALHANLE
ncbi:MAG: 6-phospho-3-hexuloisomerase [Pelatocladus maniniholoensis HA4357-MV3]|jgi:6-phospho-3-hexuloisomerase|uniref:6-phospho-3-hexuloisomerase n=1 Tax=Pelatocladus maniniholoensis HA4357-MV3 TaxID=1117104 RepID=A0A9E3H6S3_9NOST|nr:6-phospho-3-hexuloisomerase [Pelatocladus maniniholoensis HA4357-MV3]BAZ70798.1 3-hexulose-6-phosphate isomerase [Fischerella sp. NIES-4106]